MISEMRPFFKVPGLFSNHSYKRGAIIDTFPDSAFISNTFDTGDKFKNFLSTLLIQ